jgi:cation:H+ antiporter
MTTSLPESAVAVALAAVRLGAVDLTFGNVLGSNIFNILILGLDDLFYVGGPLLAVVSPSHLIPVMAVVLMNAIVLTGLTYQAIHKRLVLGWDTWGILVVSLGATLLLYAAE